MSVVSGMDAHISNPAPKPGRRLGGWWRLWIVLVSLLAAGIAAHAARGWPQLVSVTHEDRFIAQMNPAAQAVLQRPPAQPFSDFVDALRSADPGRAQEKASQLASLIYERLHDPSWASLGNVALTMPNGHAFEVAEDTPAADRELVTEEYTRVVHSELDRRRLHLAAHDLIIWLLPSASTLLIGLMIHWVRLGFAPQASPANTNVTTRNDSLASR